ncbi:caspase family protein [Streptomyces sp. NPDC093510]|uniref:caspase family protein n=1 Tax=Streptomyces sp. NPDC093510 TaxID=3155199 RepID=UPI0034349EEB
MTRRAVLIGATTHGLRGVDNDIELMQDVLAARGFDGITVCTGKDATYHGMVDALEQLCRDARDGDAIVVYYSGHGALVDGLQYLVPVDLEESTPDDFRGLLGAELTEMFRRLTPTVRNVTCVLDCCHAGALVRGPDQLRLKSLALHGTPPEAARERASRIGGAGHGLVPDLVRLTASQQGGYAFERPSPRGGRTQGLFTDALAALLQDPRTGALPWTALVRRVRDRVKQVSDQWPDAGGESGRLPFSLDVPRQPELLPLERVNERFRIPGGQLLGLNTGDVLHLVFPDDTPAPAPGGEAQADLTLTVRGEVRALDGADALLNVAPERAELTTTELPPGAHAVPVLLHDRRLVHLDATLPREFAAALRELVTSSPRLGLADTAYHPFATVLPAQQGGIEVRLADGLAARSPQTAATGGERAVAELLETLARGDRLRKLRNPPNDESLQAPVELHTDLLPAAGGGWEPLSAGSAALYPDDRYRLTVTNLSDQVLYAWIVGVGLSGRTDLITNDQPSGVRLLPQGSEHGSTVRLGPVRVFWPQDVPKHGPRPETVHLLLGNRPVDFTPLISRGARELARHDPGHPLRHLLDEVWEGALDHRRDQEPERDRELRYRVLTTHALMHPTPPTNKARS